MKKALSILLALSLILSLAACGQTKESTKAPETGTQTGTETPAAAESTVPATEAPEPVDDGSCTFRSYTTALGKNWNPHVCTTDADAAILSYLSAPLVELSVKDSAKGSYQWVYEMAESVTDVTGEHTDDLARFPTLQIGGGSVDEVKSGYVFEIALNPDACWENGKPITAEDYVYSLQQLLDPSMQNPQAKAYCSGDCAVAGGSAYHRSGSSSLVENAEKACYSISDLTEGKKGIYRTPEGGKVYWAVSAPLNVMLTGFSLADFVKSYGEAYFDLSTWDELLALADENGLVPLTDESYKLFAPVTTGNPQWGEGEADLWNYLYYEERCPEYGFEGVGCYAVDDHTFRYVTAAPVDLDILLAFFSNNWLVYEDLYEAGKQTDDEGLVSTNYGTSPETSMSYGVYKIDSCEKDKRMVFSRNEKWYGWEKQADGSLISYTDFEVDGERRQQYAATRIVIDVLSSSAAQQAFLKGELAVWTPEESEMKDYTGLEALYREETPLVESLFFNTNKKALQALDAAGRDKNAVVLSDTGFRKALSLALDREGFCAAVGNLKPALGLLNDVYYYDIFRDPESSYRGSEAAMKAVCGLYGADCGEGAEALRKACDSVTGYDPGKAGALMAEAFKALTEAGLYTAGEEIRIRIAWCEGLTDEQAEAGAAYLTEAANAAAAGTGFGRISFEAVGEIVDRESAVAGGTFAMGCGSRGGSAFEPFSCMQAYCDADRYENGLAEAGCWNPSEKELTLTLGEEEITMSWQAWSNALTANGRLAGEDDSVKLAVTAELEQRFLEKYYRIPLGAVTESFLVSPQISFFTHDYNILYGFGGLRLLKFNATDMEWAKQVAGNGGTAQLK